MHKLKAVPPHGSTVTQKGTTQEISPVHGCDYKAGHAFDGSPMSVKRNLSNSSLQAKAKPDLSRIRRNHQNLRANLTHELESPLSCRNGAISRERRAGI